MNIAAVKYNEIIGVRPNFDDTFNITQERPESWKSFITNSQFEINLKKIIHAFTAPISTNLNDRKSIWVQGTYGTGKSHSTSVIKHLLCDPQSEIMDFVKSLSDRQLKYDIEEYRKAHISFPVVLKGRYTINDVKDMAYVIQQETRAALERAGVSINIKTDYEMAIKVLNNPSYESFWDNLLQNELKIYCKTKQDIEKRLIDYDRDVLSIIDEKFKNDTGASFGTSSIVNWLKDVKNQLVANGIANSLLIVWDEFTSLLSGAECRSILNTVQDIAEMSKALDDSGEPEGIYIFLVTHKTFEQTDAYKLKDAEERKLALDRFITCSYDMQPNTTYHILSSTLDRKDEGSIKKLVDDRINSNLTVSNLIDRICENTVGNMSEIRNKIISLYPFHPYTAYLSTFVSRQLGASERSVFNFLNDESVGFKKFINSAIEEEKFLAPNSIWDFFLKINNDTASSGTKLAEIINKYNMHLDDVKKKGSNYLNIFKTVLLLNTLNSVVSTGEENNERSLVVPNIRNIRDCYSGIYEQTEVDEALEYLDSNSIVVKSPEGIFEVSTSSISQEDLNAYKKKNYEFFNEITKCFEVFPTLIDPLKRRITKNNGKTMRKVEFISLSCILKNTQIETLLTNKVKNNHALYVVAFFAHGTCDNLNNIANKERGPEEIKQSILSFSKRSEFANVVFCYIENTISELDFNRFIESYSRSEIIEKTSDQEAKSERSKASGRIKNWVDYIVNDGELYTAFRGENDITNVAGLASKVCDKYIPFVFTCGLDTLKTANKDTIWEEKGAKAAIEAFLYEQRREDIEKKLTGGLVTNLRCLLKDENNNYIFDQDMNLLPNAPETHPIVKLIKAVQSELKASSVSPLIDLTTKLAFLFDVPYGYYGNPISYSAVSLSLKQFVDKIFVADNGIKVDKTVMKDIVEALFKFKSTGKSNTKLKVRFSSAEELTLIDTLNQIFKFNQAGLTHLKWEIRKTFTKDCKFPLWMLKYLSDGQTQKYNSALDELFVFTTDADETINQNKICSLLKNIGNIKIDLSIAYDKVKDGQTDLLGKFINITLQQNTGSTVVEEEIESYKMYIKQHIQDEISLWKEQDVVMQIITCYTQKMAESIPQNNSESTPEVPTAKIDLGVTEDISFADKLKGCKNSIDELKSILIEVAKKFPEVVAFIENLLV